MNAKPYLVITNDADGLRLWLSVFRPNKKRVGDAVRYSFASASSAIRLPMSWFGGIVPPGGYAVYDIDEMFFVGKAGKEKAKYAQKLDNGKS